MTEQLVAMPPGQGGGQVMIFHAGSQIAGGKSITGAGFGNHFYREAGNFIDIFFITGPGAFRGIGNGHFLTARFEQGVNNGRTLWLGLK